MPKAILSLLGTMRGAEDMNGTHTTVLHVSCGQEVPKHPDCNMFPGQG